MLTSASIIAALKISDAVILNLLASPYNTIQTSDITNWSALGLNPATDTAKLILNILGPVNNIPIYTNTGWNTNSFAAPDTVFSNTPSLTGPLVTLPVLTGSSPPLALSGNYTVQVQVQVIQGGGTPVTGQTSFTTVIQTASLIRCPKIVGTYACNTSPTTFTATDTTPLGSNLYEFVSAVQSITVTPPTVTGQSPTTASGTTVTINNLWAPAPYQYNSSGVINYSYPGSADTFAVNYTAYGSTDVVCNSVLCQMYCWLSQISKKFLCEKNTTKKFELEQMLLLGNFYFQQCVRAQLCGDNAGFGTNATQFNCVTDFDPNCSCCDNLGPAPVIPSGASGPAGQNGLTPQFQYSGGWIQWKYTTTSVWINLYQPPAGVPGPPGPTAVSVLYNNFSGNATGTNTLQTLDNFTLVAGQFANLNDEVDIETVYDVQTNQNDPTNQYVVLNINSGGLTIQVPVTTAIIRIKIFLKLVRTDFSGATKVSYIGTVKTYTVGNSSNYVVHQEYDVQGQMGITTLANPIPVLAQAKSVVAGDLLNFYLAVKYESS